MVTLRNRSREIVQLLERRSVDICCVQETIFKGRSVRMISGKASDYKLFWIENETGSGGAGIFLAKRWVDKVIVISRGSDRMIVVTVLVQEIIVTVISVYVLKCSLDDSQKDDFYDSLVNDLRKLREKEVVVIAGDFTGHVGSNPKDYEDHKNITVENTLLKKRVSDLVTYEFVPSKTQVDYCLVR